MKQTLFVIIALLAACGGQQQPEDSVQMKDAVVRDIERERAEHPTTVQPDEPEPEEELAVEMFELRAGENAVAADGLRVSVQSAGPQWAFNFDHHGRKSELLQSGNPMYVEGNVYGTLFVIRGEGATATVTLRSDTAEPLGPEAALALAQRERRGRLECEGTVEKPEARNNGTFALLVYNDAGEQTCEVTIGRFTQEAVDF